MIPPRHNKPDEREFREEPLSCQLEEMSFGIETSNRVETIRISESIGQGYTHVINIGNRIRLINRDILPRETTTVHYRNRLPEQTTVGALSLFGDSLSDLRNIRRRLHHCQGNYHWGHVPQEDCGSVFPGQKRSSMLYISVSHDLLTQLPDPVEPKNQSSLWRLMTGREGGVCPPRLLPMEDLAALRDLTTRQITTPWDWILVEAKVLEILSNSLFQYDHEASEVTAIPLSAEDREKIMNARDLLIRRMDTPPTIADIAKAVALNTFKLKKGFKQLYGTTMMAYLRARRLDKAYELIRSGEMNVSEAASEVGYANTGAFSSAFRKAYGVNPIECRKRYYHVPDLVRGPEAPQR